MQKSRSFFQTKLKLTEEFLLLFFSKNCSTFEVLRYVFLYCAQIAFCAAMSDKCICNALRLNYGTHCKCALQFLLLQRLKIHSENFNSLRDSLPAEALFI